MTPPARRKASRRRATPRTNKQHDLWETKPASARPEAIVPAADAAALINSLGPVPLPGHAATADLYVTTVVERAAALATALAASAGLLAQRPDEPAGGEPQASL